MDEIEFVVKATDGAGATDTATIDIDIEDVNEPPYATPVRNTSPIGLTVNNLAVNQSETQKVVLYIKLYDLWRDDRDEDDDLSYGAEAYAAYGAERDIDWVTVKALGEWGDVKKGPDGETDGGDDLTWPSSSSYFSRVIGTSGKPADGDAVAIVEIDRVTRKVEFDNARLNLTATDEDGATGSREYTIYWWAQNVIIGENAVTLSGSAREGSSLRVRFDDDKDPDLTVTANAGAKLTYGHLETPALVIYTWSRIDDKGTADTSDDVETVLRVTTSDAPYTPCRPMWATRSR